MRFYKLASIVACLASRVFGVVDDNNFWAYPGQELGPYGDVLWQIGSTQPLQWSTELTDYNITLWQMNPTSLAGVAWTTTNGNGAGKNKTFDWKVQTYSADVSLSSRFMLWGGAEINNTAPSSGFTSFGFNITDNPVTTSTTAGGSSTSTSVTSATTGTASTTTSTNGAPASSAASQSPNPNPNPGPSKLGIGVGVGLGVAVAIALGIFAWFMVKRRRAKDYRMATNPPTWAQDDDKDTFSSPGPSPPVYESTNMPSECKGGVSYAPVELSADRGLSELRG